MKEADHRSSVTIVNLGPALAAELRQLAAESGRDFTAEGRHAVREHLRAHGRDPLGVPVRHEPGRQGGAT